MVFRQFMEVGFLSDAPVKPRTLLLRQGQDQAAPASYFPHEEVPRAGGRVTPSFRRTRWHDCRVWLWLSVRKQTGATLIRFGGRLVCSNMRAQNAPNFFDGLRMRLRGMT